MSATNPNRRPLTYEDYALLPADGRRWELMGGDFHVSPAPTCWHQAVVAQLVFQFMTAFQDGSARVFPSPIDVILDDTNTVQPDVVVVGAQHRHLISRRGIEGAPDLVVEVISPDYAAKDQVLKRHLFERFGISEYWLINPEDRSFVALGLRDGKYVELATLRGSGTFTSLTFPQLRVQLERLLRDI
ncbi:MAG: Uma2 family endonuclease [Archangium sp.]|nr:Uma2 family endonuclease [Archangium sp.]